MKIAHLADLHLGKTIRNYSLLKDQEQLLNEIGEKIILRETDVVLLCGDIYDKPVPSVEAIQVFDRFLSILQSHHIEVFIIAGNHDSGERLSFASHLLNQMNVHLVGTWKGTLEQFDLLDAYGPYHVYCLPYLRPSMVNRYIEKEEEKVHNLTEAIQYALSTVTLNKEERNILLAHQFVIGAQLDGSEEIIAGGLEAVSADLFQDYDYTALGHIHNEQSVGSPYVRYAGTFMSYSFSETTKPRSFTSVVLEEKGNSLISVVEVKPIHPMEVLKGTFQEIISDANVQEHENSYVKIVLTEEDEIPNVVNTLKKYYPYLLQMEYDNTSTRAQSDVLSLKPMAQEKSPKELISEFFEQRTGKPLNESQNRYLDEQLETCLKKEEE